MSNEINSPNINLMTTPRSELQQQQPIVSPSLSPNVFKFDEHQFSPAISPTISTSPLNINLDHQQNTITS